jgi:alpha-galactosidase|tara:strand:- start:96 stop:1034 length:939 start_codon:yes stop_codon:yes gene_type:complete
MLHNFYFSITLLLVLFVPSTQAFASDIVRVFILAGQSNMVGAGEVESNPSRNGGKGSLQWLTENSSTKDKYSHLKTDTGAWVQRDDVLIWFLNRKGLLEPGYGSNEKKIGPELGFGWTVGEAFKEPVVLIKVAWGGKSLAEDFRPPSLDGDTGPYYVEVIEKTKEILNTVDKHFPELKGKTFELTGFGWHQGWNDRINQSFNDAYEENMIQFIKDIRHDLGKPTLPFVIAETGMSGPEEKHPRALSLMAAQKAVADYPDFNENVAFVPTQELYRPPDDSPSKQAYHWNNNAETYYLIGEQMGEAMLDLLKRK